MKDQQISALKLELRTVNCYVKSMSELKQQDASREAQHAAHIRELKEELQKKELELREIREHLHQQETPRFLSLSAPVSNDTITMYQSVIEQWNRDVLSLQRSQGELTAQLNASQPLSVSSYGEISDENWSCVEQLKKVMETLQQSLHQKNEIIAHQNDQLQLVISERDELRKKCDELARGLHLSECNSQLSSESQMEELIQVQSQLEEKTNQLQHLQNTYSNLISSVQQQSQQLSTQLHTELSSLRSGLQSVYSDLSTQQSSIMTWLSTEVESLLNHYTVLDEHQSDYRHQIALLRDEIQNYKGNYRVMIRTRPILPIDHCRISSITVSNEYQVKLTNDKDISKLFTFGRVFGSTTSQEDVFIEVEPVIMSIFRGINACVLAYGQTGSGKTYTMIGEKGYSGIVYRSVHTIFDELTYRTDANYSLKVMIVLYYEDRSVYVNCMEK